MEKVPAGLPLQNCASSWWTNWVQYGSELFHPKLEATMSLSAAELNRKLVGAIVKLRLRDRRKRLLIEEERVEEDQRTVTARLLSNILGNHPPDPLGNLSLNMIEGEVEVEVAKPEAVATLACLNGVGVFDKRLNIRYEFRNPITRSTHVGEEAMWGVYTAFPFSKVFDAAGLHEAIVSDQGRLVLAVFARIWGYPEVRFEIAPPGHGSGRLNNPQVLPEGWGLDPKARQGRP